MKSERHSKVAAHVFYQQFKWSLWFFSILFAIHIVRIFFLNSGMETVEGFFIFAYQPVNIFMLVCGIMIVYVFMGQHIHQGISRKEWYKGTALSAIGLALVITLVTLLINGIQYALQQFISLPVGLDNAIAFGAFEGSLSSTAGFFFNALTFYMIGWMIGIGYYRFGWLLGFGFIALALVGFSLNDFFWEGNVYSTLLASWVPQFTPNTSFVVAITGSVLLIAALFVFMVSMTKRVTIKM